jgi:hypothetical protein
MPPAAIDRSFHRWQAPRNEMSARMAKKHFGAMQHAPGVPADGLSVL